MLPNEAVSGHIIPGFKQSLISVTKLCKYGCTVIYEHDCCRVLYKGHIIMYALKCPHSNLWMVPLLADTVREVNLKKHTQFVQEQANHIHETSSQAELVQYLHQ